MDDYAASLSVDVATCSRPTASSTWRARSSASAASARAPGWSCWSAAKARTRSCCRRRRRSRRCSSRISARASSTTRASASSAASGFAGGERHLPRLAAQRRPRRQAVRLLRPSALGLEGLGGSLDDGRGRSARLHASLRLVAGARARPLRGPARDRRLPGARARASTARSPLLDAPTPTRTSSTTDDSSMLSPRARSPPSPASEPGRWPSWSRSRPHAVTIGRPGGGVRGGGPSCPMRSATVRFASASRPISYLPRKNSLR